MAFAPKVKEKAEFDRLWKKLPNAARMTGSEWLKCLEENGCLISEMTVRKWIKRAKAGVVSPVKSEQPEVVKPEGKFNVQDFLNANLEGITMAALEGALAGNAKQSEMLLKITGMLAEKKEVKVERTNAEIASDAQAFIGMLKDGLKKQGTCPVCGRQVTDGN